MGESLSEAESKEHAESRTTLSDSFRHAFGGLWYALRTQRNLRIHFAAAGAVLILGLYLGIGWLEWAMLLLTIGSVMVSEMFNTVAEAAMDAATPYYHPLVKVAKDVAAGGVLLSSVVAALVGLLVLGPPLWAKIVELLAR